MRLKKIEVLGFKSFADRQVIVVDDHVTGVIGPNGCGKSNIVDAVRWSMGEQSAKHLRGSGMSDVIFAGCASRGPAGMAEVTLTFDNDGREGDTLEMPQVAITRRLFADGTSEYLINKVPARLRDITELLMGTGAGAKGYSIIEQGQVGKIVTSKPEERRHIIDEAAGITRFKSQKAAAQRKIEATRQNLTRVGDIVSELEGRITSLRRQAQKAERYRRYRDELRDLELWIASHKFLELLTTGAVLKRRRDELSLRVEDLRASIGSRDSQIHAGRLAMAEVETELTRLQQEVYDADNRVRLLETQADYRRRERDGLLESSASSRGEADAAQRGLASVEEEMAGVEAELASLGDGRGEDGPVAKVERLTSENEAYAERLVEARRAHDEAADAHAASIEGLAELRATLVARAEADVELRERMAQVDVRIEAEAAAVQSAGDARQEADTRKTDAAAQLARLQEERTALDAERRTLREHVAAAEVELDTQRAEVHRARSRLQSLEEIQARYRGCDSSVQVVMEHAAELVQPTVDGGEVRHAAAPTVHGILADFIDAPARMEAAVSAVLGDRLQGIVVDDPQIAAAGVALLKQLQEGRTTFLPRGISGHESQATVVVDDARPIGWASASEPAPHRIEVIDLSARTADDAGPADDARERFVADDAQSSGEAQPLTMSRAPGAMASAPRARDPILDAPGVSGRLRDIVQLGGRLGGLAEALMGDTLVVEDLARGLELWRAHGRRHAFVTLDGDRIEPSGVVVGGSPTSLDSALLKQKREIAELQEILESLNDGFEQTRGRHLALAGRLTDVERAREASEQGVLEAQALELRAEQAWTTANDDHTRATTAHIAALAQRDRDRERLAQREREQVELTARVEVLEATREESLARRDAGAALTASLEERGASLGEELTEARVALAKFQQQADGLGTALDRLRRQVGSERDRITKLREAAAKADARVAELALEGQEATLERDTLVELSRTTTAKVHDARERHDARRLGLDELEASVRTLRGDLDEQREQLQEVELGLQEIALERTHLEQGVVERFDVPLAATVIDFHHRPRAGKEEETQQKELRRLLSRMGEVNLTAIDEFEEVSERYEYLSAQQADLEKAIGQLQEAIDRINRTTRQLFRDAFMAIDERFQQLFPRLFNGGRARLKMTDPSDLLSTGVEIEAQPPGKQLRSLELLSGGEKALTAASLIFAVFLFKPSPFCILDEVDAPLDDANVGRICKLVRELSADTQFIVITHNKVSMESSDRLYGVTMEQRGISKLVSVNIRRAVELAYN
jgi:chromosome segregation protein